MKQLQVVQNSLRWVLNLRKFAVSYEMIETWLGWKWGQIMFHKTVLLGDLQNSQIAVPIFAFYMKRKNLDWWENGRQIIIFLNDHDFSQVALKILLVGKVVQNFLFHFKLKKLGLDENEGNRQFCSLSKKLLYFLGEVWAELKIFCAMCAK